MKRLYIFTTVSINMMGGIQSYISAKQDCLKHMGWNVKILFSDVKKRQSPFLSLRSYRNDYIPEFYIQPAKLKNRIIEKVIERAIIKIGNYQTYDQIIIESHNDLTSQWSELIAERIGAKHIILLLNEKYRNNNQCYVDKIDFYKFKFYRKEIFGRIALSRLFDGYIHISEDDYNRFDINESPIQDVECSKIQKIKRADYNICYIGRTNKGYVKSIFEGVNEFSKKHIDDKTQFIILGDPNHTKELIKTYFEKSANVIITELGEIVPIPKKLFDNIDVVIAGSGSARCSAAQGMFTIVADIERNKSLGVLGCDTQESVYWDGHSEILSFCDSLEKVLVEKAYNKCDIKYSEKSVTDCVNQNFTAIMKSDVDSSYYSMNSLTSGKKVIYPLYKIKFFIMRCFPKLFKMITKIVK